MMDMGWIKVVGIGPGDALDMTFRARDAIKECGVVIGYTTYINLIKPFTEDKKVITSGMRQETDRARKAVRLAAEGERVCVVSSGDPGIYGMAGLIYEMAEKEDVNLDIEVISGVTALGAAAAILGAPIMQDFVAISLSDHLTSWQAIERKLELVSQADFVIALYNPKSKERPENLLKAQQAIMKHRRKDVPVGIVKNASRKGQKSIITTLAEMTQHEADMNTIIIVGNDSTFVTRGKMITSRGYAL